MPDEDVESNAAPLIEHLAELRTRLIRSVMAFVIAMIACFTVSATIFDFLAEPLCAALESRDQSCDIIYTGLQEGFLTQIRLSMFGGFFVAFPFIGFQMWKFVAPGLYRQEKNAFLPFLIASPLMFMLGAAFAFYAVLPLAFDFFLGFQKVGSSGELEAIEGSAGPAIAFLGRVSEYLGLTMKFVLAFGLCFQLPVLLSLMGKAGLVSSAALIRTRKYAVIGILALAAVVTPPDVITQVILFVVVYSLYEISIQLVAMIEKKRDARLREEGIFDDEDDAEDPAPEAPKDPKAP